MEFKFEKELSLFENMKVSHKFSFYPEIFVIS